ncbi:hypothetical protein GWK47_054111 [Chionoecetes opilio]|uniref:Uncharacterized protein n=1 Tax=Chionoecetes opilio TaxID=41210 RepID=A0A8J5CQ66_CHIOP|nr:hypothetical protein GWK47_054111 [Chionoecetes opilio]
MGLRDKERLPGPVRVPLQRLPSPIAIRSETLNHQVGVSPQEQRGPGFCFLDFISFRVMGPGNLHRASRFSPGGGGRNESAGNIRRRSGFLLLLRAFPSSSLLPPSLSFFPPWGPNVRS